MEQEKSGNHDQAVAGQKQDDTGQRPGGGKGPEQRKYERQDGRGGGKRQNRIFQRRGKLPLTTEKDRIPNDNADTEQDAEQLADADGRRGIQRIKAQFLITRRPAAYRSR